MKWVSFAADGTGRVRTGVLDDGQVYELDTRASLTELIAAGTDLVQVGHDARRSPARVHGSEQIRLTSPIRPGQLRDAMCFHEHIRNCFAPEPIDARHEQFPAFYFANAASVIGPNDEVPIPPGCDQFDFELEVAAVIGERGANVPPAEAESLVVGYTMYIDWSARDLQMNEMVVGLGPSKGKDSSTTLGPVLVTADEFADRRSGLGFDIELSAEVNGRHIATGNWSSINWSVADVISYIARGTVVNPCDVIGFGTVGTGCLYEHYKLGSDAFTDWLRPGDRVSLAAELIGRTDQVIVDGPAKHPISTGF